MTYIPQNSILATQGTVPWSVIGVQSISGTVGASIIGQPPPSSVYVLNPVSTITVTPAANQSVSGTVGASVVGHAPVIIIGGSIAASFTPPANQSVSGTVQTDVRSSVATVIIGGSIAASFTPPANQSVSGEVSVSNFPTNQNVSGSVVAFQGTPEWTVKSSLAGGIFPVSGSVAAVVTNFPTTQNVSGSVAAWLQSSNASVITVGAAAANQSVSGTVDAAQISTWRVSVINSTPSSLLAGVSVIGLTPVNVTNTNINVSGSVVSHPTSGSVIATQGGTWRVSLVSTIPSSVIVGASIFGTAPVTQATTPWVVGSVVTTTPGTPFRYIGSVVSTSVTLIAPSVSGQRNYITDYWLSNTGATTTRVTFRDGSTSLVAHAIAPTGGGSNSQGIRISPQTAPSQDLAFQAITATSVLYLTVNGYTV